MIEEADSPVRGVLLALPPGQCPTVPELLRHADLPVPAPVRLAPPGIAAGSGEVVYRGLCFRLRGCRPGPPVPVPAACRAAGWPDELAAPGLSGIEIACSEHVVAGAGLVPVVQAQLGLAMELALVLPVVAVAWLPAATLVDPRDFVRAICGWVAGGPFPAAILGRIATASDGSVATRGLALFTGQEIWVEGLPSDTGDGAMAIGCWLADRLVRHGPLAAPRSFDTGIERICAEPSPSGRQVRVWRGPPG